MKLKIKNLNWIAGRPVVILNSKTAQRLNVFANDRVAIKNSKKIYAIVDIFSGIVKNGEIGISEELSKILGLKDRSKVDVTSSEISDATYLIKKKISGHKLNEKEIEYLISEIVHNNLTEAEIAYFTAAQKLKGMTLKETIMLTKAMVKTGAKLKFSGKYIADKHCIGGIAGNRTTPIVVSICAAAGLTLPKTSSRAITSASGTADVIETISNIDIPIKELERIVNKTNGCLAWGGSLGLAPSDDKIIRVERILNLDIEPQLLASIMAKKISAGSKYILIDIPVGKGTKIQDRKKAESLGKKFKLIAKHFKVKLKVVYTNGEEPIGNGMGPVLEMFDILKILKNETDAPLDLKEKSLKLSTELLDLCNIKNAREIAEQILHSGKAFEKFKEIINAQNNSSDFEIRIKRLKTARFKKIIRTKKSGFISSISNTKINSLCRILGTPETISAGVYLHKKMQPVKKGEKIITLYSESRSKIKDGLKFIKATEPIIIKKKIMS